MSKMSAAPATSTAQDRFEAGILIERQVGRTRLIRGNPSSPIAAPLREMLVVTAGPVVLLAEEFESIAGIEVAFLYGSFAARLLGVAEAAPNDIDVMVLGSPESMLSTKPAPASSQRCAGRSTRRSSQPTSSQSAPVSWTACVPVPPFSLWGNCRGSDCVEPRPARDRDRSRWGETPSESRCWRRTAGPLVIRAQQRTSRPSPSPSPPRADCGRDRGGDGVVAHAPQVRRRCRRTSLWPSGCRWFASTMADAAHLRSRVVGCMERCMKRLGGQTEHRISG